MKRTMCGLVMLAALTALWSCGEDITESIREGERLEATPSSVLVIQGEPEFVTARLVDGQGNAVVAEVEAEQVGPGITVEKDTTYLKTTIGTTLQTSDRFIVSGSGAVSSSFVLRSGEHTITIPVRVVGSHAGTADPATAPVLPLPAVGESNNAFDIPDFVASVFAYYQITVPEGAGGVDITLNWPGDADMDLFVCPAPLDPAFADCDFAAATGAHPEHATYALAPGTYYLVVNLYSGAAPRYLFFEFTTEPPAPAP